MSWVGIIGTALLIVFAIDVAVEAKSDKIDSQLKAIEKNHAELKRVVDLLRDDQLEKNNFK
ncbi:MAG: hypothetical protein ABF695_12385 [Liquorilactobacillus ghanensis]|uniref:hypothetical protein n=1 Tax=Liquorilactobacillus ghanensis TaxID=399370 RepID=UPI0039ED3DFD